jgi:hypothetical protein
MVSTLQFSYPFDLLSVQKGGREENLTVPEAACGAIAEAYNVDGIEDFTARFRLTRLAKDEYALVGHFSAVVLQTCILTLKPMRTLTEQDFERRYDIVPSRTAKKPDSAAIVELDSEDRETLQGTSLDLAVPLLEELSLSIDPYPKIEGARFEGDFGESSSEESPFAVLRLLKDKMEPPEKT